MDFDLRSLGHAQALAEHASFARAANVLHLTQPALSRSIQQLEQRVGARLFDRGRRGVEPTEIGRIFLQHARELLARAGDLTREIAIIKDTEVGVLTIGAGAYTAEAMVGSAVAALVQRYPDLTVRVQIDNWANLTGLLHRREVELVVADATQAREDPTLDVIPLARYQGYFVVRAGHPLARRRAATLPEVLESPIVSTGRLPARILEPLLKASRKDRRKRAREIPSVTCESLTMMKRVAALSDAVAILPLKMAAREIEAGELVALPLVEPWLNASFAVMRLARRTFSRAGEAFVGILQSDHARFAREERVRARRLVAGIDRHRVRKSAR
jgi:DNA-binding transcriptional LysR family regulator